ncbi:uncharacterized protein LOC110465069 [Mizuhopecten yessoensis]|uniref:Uncharacterized protein n=1 Tax=Mizuhopecten yessoensis TaxID=6573 RepID=A0A210PSF6_MIZYE|nr:uncharacterized protein LOC110465069 [Mizuhopecten yessoensis]OWF39419.1 hypothetical protein KP79_PYT22961 [Mizuhopecten yessoensis]
MYELKALVWIVLTAYIVTAVTGDNRAEDTNVIRYVSKTDDVRTDQPTSKPLKNTVIVGDNEARENTKYVSLHVNKSATKQTENYRTNFSVKAQLLFPKHKHGRNRTLINSRTLRSCCHRNALRTFITKSLHNSKPDEHEQNNDAETHQTRETSTNLNSRHLQLSDETQTDNDVGSRSHGTGRRRRYAYEDNYDMQYDERFDYDDDPEETKKWKKYAKNWDKIGLRLIYMGSTAIMVTCFCCVCCRKCCQLACDSCCHCFYNCFDRIRCRDPMYRKIKNMCDRLDIKMDYATYKNLKQGYTQDLAEQGFQFNL